MLSQKCRITALILALVFAIFACPLNILPVQAGTIDSTEHQTEGAQVKTADAGITTSEVAPPDPSSEVEPPISQPSTPESSPPEPSSSQPEEFSSEPPPTEAPPEPTWEPDPTEEPNYNEGNTATATPRPTRSPSSSSGSAGITRPTVTLKPNSGNTESSGTEQKESNYVTFATMNVKQNSFATSLFYGGVACIFLGAVGIVVLIVLFIKNRRSRKNDRDGIFEEIEQAELRGRAAQGNPVTAARPPQAQQSGQMNRPAPRQPGMNGQVPRPLNHTGQNAIKPADISMYTEELDIPTLKKAAPPISSAEGPAPPGMRSDPSPNSSDTQFDTEEILREALYQDDDFEDL